MITYEQGSVSVDEMSDLWLCVSTGTPGTWTRLLREDTAPGRVVPITPVRVLDTCVTGGRPPGAPAVPGQRGGRLGTGEAITLDLGGVAPIPATASAVIGNATVFSPTVKASLHILPDGATVPASTAHFRQGSNESNSFTCTLTPTGRVTTPSLDTSLRYHVVIDIAAYVT
ncbi:MAG: hypothetical protein ABIP36_00960 [Acidimicrobiales bacterium]